MCTCSIVTCTDTIVINTDIDKKNCILNFLSFLKKFICRVFQVFYSIIFCRV